MTYIIIFLLTLILWITVGVGTNKESFIKVDTDILSYFHKIQNKTLDVFFETITWFGSLWVLFPLYIGLVFFLFKNGYKNIMSLNIIFFGAVGTTYLIKYLMDRKRPDIFDTIGDMPFDPSFPSAHTTQIAVFSLILMFVLFEYNFENKLIYCFIVFMFFIFVINSRMYLQVHYLSDIIGGVLIALFWFFIGLKLIGKGI